MINLKYIVTGTGRCGTLSMANLLTTAGYPCGHEAVFTFDGMEKVRRVLDRTLPAISSPISRGENLSDAEIDIVADSSYMAAPFLGEFMAPVIHVVRNPLDVVSSMTGGAFRNFTKAHPVGFPDDPLHVRHEEFVYLYIPEMRNENLSQIERCCRFYVNWNLMIEKSGRVAIRHRIEDEPIEVLKFLGASCDYENKRANSKPQHRKWSLSDLADASVKRDLLDMMSRYGYTPD